MIERLSEDRRKQVPSRDGKPGPKWVCGLYDLHKDKLQWAVVRSRETKRQRACNAFVYVSYFSALHAMAHEYELDGKRAFNLDESSCTPG